MTASLDSSTLVTMDWGAGAVNVMYGSFSSNGLTNANRNVFTADSIGIGGLAGAHFGAALY